MLLKVLFASVPQVNSSDGITLWYLHLTIAERLQWYQEEQPVTAIDLTSLVLLSRWRAISQSLHNFNIVLKDFELRGLIFEVFRNVSISVHIIK